ncbi:MAG TPA: hypothetical protein VGF76_11670, partial [Polyangiaceae bacterium]
AGALTITSGGGGGASAAGAAGSGVAGSGVVGSGGMSGATAGQGSAGQGGAGGTSGALKSAGCGALPTQSLATYTKFPETVAGVAANWTARNYFVWLPNNYDPMRAYPTVFVGPGCGGTGDQGIPIMKASQNDAIVVGLDPDPTAEGRPCFNSETYPDPEEPYFNETLKEVEAKYCVDRSKLFVAGFSSGSWLANLIGCVDGDVIRGQGNASGCMQGAHPTCKGPVAYIAGHDMNDGNNSYQCGEDNRDRIVTLNGCSTETEPYDPGPDVKAPQGATISCVQYKNCKPGYPVVWCTTTGLGHNDQTTTGLSTFGFWKFWMSLPSLTTTAATP